MPTNDTENIYSTEFENDPNPIPSTRIGYDNTASGLEATTVQGAIDELDSKIKASDEASEITYDNTESGLEAENVQDAIDELDDSVDKLTSLTNDGYIFKGYETLSIQSDTSIADANSKLLAGINNYLSELNPDDYVMLKGLRVGGTNEYQYGSVQEGGSALWNKNTVLTNNLTALGFVGLAETTISELEILAV